MDDLLREFLTETSENLSVLDLELVRLEQAPDHPELLSNIFRLVHTIKGTCGFLGLPRLEKVAHAGENVLGKFRDGELKITSDAVSLILACIDSIKGILAALEATEAEPEGDDSELIAELDRLVAGKAPVPVTLASESGTEAEAEAEADTDTLAATTEGADPVTSEEPASEYQAPPVTVAAVEATRAPATTEAVAAPATHDAGEPTKIKDSAIAAQSIRVNVGLLENLMTMVSELVLTRNQLMQILRSQKDSEFLAPLQRLNHVTSELQEGVMKTRMQPIGNAWAKLPRLVRDLSHELTKKIDLQMLGADTELDRQVLELIKDPLTHMVRNSADHGLEAPVDRMRAGKTETGRITLNAYHEGGHIIIEVADDGRGLPMDKIRQKIVANGLASEAELATMAETQIQQFIFKAGFSTAQKVTSVSGRGVGMDVVKTNIEKIGGTVELKSTEGKGSTFVIKIPLTLAIVSALIVESGGERFAIPQISVIELVRAANDSEHTIERLKDTPFLRLRNRLLPLVSLRTLLKLGEPETKSDETYIVVTQVGAYTFGIMVDRVFDTEEIVVKPVAPILRNIQIFSGNTILGDGSVIMILDPNGIAERTGEMHHGAPPQAANDPQNRNGFGRGDKTALLLFRAGAGAPKCVPLALVARLEDIPNSSVEYSNGMPVAQYRGKLMPLVSIDPNTCTEGEGSHPVLVFADGDRSMGLIVDEIVDIVEERLDVQLRADRPGNMGSAIIAGKATDVIDAGHYLTQACGDWFGGRDQRSAYEEKTQRRVLLVDDSPFFRNLLAPLLGVAGYQVTTVGSGAEALELCQSSEGNFDVIVSDIEMPGMSGFDLATKLRQEERWQNTPVLALSSHATEHDLTRGRAAGFTDYVAKFDRDALLTALEQSLTERGAAA